MPLLQFQPLSSQPTPSFWTALNTLKLDKLKLDDAQQPINAWLSEGKEVIDRESTGGDKRVGVAGTVGVGGSAFGVEAERPPPDTIALNGIFKNFNTIEEFKSTESKKEIFNSVVDSITASFETESPDLNPFLLVTFADLKKYVYHYWFAFPALVAKPGWEIDEAGLKNLDEEVSSNTKTGVIILADQQEMLEVRKLEETLGVRSGAFLLKGAAGQRSVGHLKDAPTFFEGVDETERYVAFHDPSSLPDAPGWPLRNVLYYLHHRHFVTSINVICLRGGSASRKGHVSVPLSDGGSSSERPQAVGWERNSAGKLASRVADLGPMMDPARLADQAVDLNLKLMRWRIMPSLQLDKVAATKCLLLGAGTLGCYVARALMGWGVRNITFVDSAKVSYSNPVRQPLFDFEDCLDGGKPKAQCAADRLKKIFPGVNSAAHAFMIPMPGHPVPSSSVDQTREDVARLEKLIEEHDAVFLLMDSRESRWLPTVIAASQGKIVINAALGFDSYLVMRHGASPDGVGDEKRLGCYYCNDVVAPADSLSDRTLDQMCTVTRPGVAPIASASAVELLVSLVQHPKGIHAPAEHSDNLPKEGEGSPLGVVPHQLRAQLGSWKTLQIEGAAYDRCTGCSKLNQAEEQVVDAYRKDGFDMLLQAFNETDYLEKLTGLDELHKESEAVLDSMDWEEGSEEDF